MIRLPLVALGLLIAGSTQAATPLAADLPLDELRIFYDLPALGVAVDREGEVSAHVAGVRKFGDQTRATTDDQWHLGSDTKAMTATLVAMLVEEGKLRWDSTLKELLGDLMTIDPGYAGVTVEMLLSHYGGTPANPSDDIWARLYEPALAPKDGRRLVAAETLRKPPTSTPGTDWVYSNTGYMIVGAAIEALLGQTWETAIKQRLFDRLGMTSCGFGPAGTATATPPDQPWAHATGTDGLPSPVEPGPEADNPPSLGPAGTVHCALRDWLAFARLHVDGLNARPTRLLGEASFKKLHTPYKEGGTYTPGGWGVSRGFWARGMVLRHDGSNTLNLARIVLAPVEDMAFVIVTNYGGTAASEAFSELEGYVQDAIRKSFHPQTIHRP